MLKCTGFFRGIECPYERVGGEGQCRRPYCHFRHGGRGGSTTTNNNSNNNNTGGGTNNNNSSNSGGADSPAQELGYDPYSPEIPKLSSRAEDGSVQDASDSQLDILELERVNQAIEAVKSEVEREQKRYAELLETKKDYSVSEASLQASRDKHKRATCKSNSFSALKYDPGSCLLNTSTNYNPTPLPTAAKGKSKYTLDVSDGIKPKKSSMEYVPTVVVHTQKNFLMNKKYVVDKSKPLTDLEYDPLSNYSARLICKASKVQKRTKRSRGSSQEDHCAPSLKKHCSSITSFETLARFSDSDDDYGTDSQASPPEPEPQPSKRTLENKCGSSLEKTPRLEKEDRASRELREIAVQYDMADIKRPELKNVDGLEKNGKVEHEELVSSKSSQGKGTPKEKVKTNEKGKSSCQQDTGKKEKKKSEKEEKVKIKNSEKNCKEKVKKNKLDASLDGHETPKSEKTVLAKKDDSRSSSRSSKTKNAEVSKDSIPDKLGGGKKHSKVKATEIKNGRHSSGSKSKDPKRHDSGQCAIGKQRAIKPDSEKVKPAPKQRSLSHVDLFGDESDDDEHSLSQPVPQLDLSSDSGQDASSLGEKKKSLKHLKPTSSRTSVSSETSSDVDYSGIEKCLDYDSDPMEECLRIFNESSDVKTEDKGRQRNQLHREENFEDPTDSSSNLLPGQKRRISHLGNSANAETPSKPVIRPYRRPTAQEVCYQRIRQAQEQAAQLVAQLKAGKQQVTLLTVQKPPLTVPGEKKRISHGQIGTPAIATKISQSPEIQNPAIRVSSVKSVNGSSSGSAALKSRTHSGMTSKTTTTSLQKRVAHAPSLQSASLKRPIIPTEFGAKVPTNIRQRYLNIFIDECLKFSSSEQEAFDKALYEEKVVYDRSSSRNIYLNVAVNTVKKLRSLTPGSPPSLTRTENKKTISHEAMLGGKLAAKTSFSLKRSVSLREEDLKGTALYKKLKHYLLSEEQLKENGYPMPHPEKSGRAVIFTTEEKKNSDALCRVCCRCGTEYFVSVSGNCIRKEECVHHWGRLRRQRVPGGWETHYNCCSGAVGSPGCQVAKQHVQDGRKEQLDGFVKTFAKEYPADSCPGTFALDCEMCYTKQGLELTRITVINSELKVVYDTFVKPENKVVDYNTRFSGVTEEDLENTQITLRDVQAVLLNMFCSETILIGHSLESDLFALKLIHCTVVDTAIVFPHRLGFPYKRALRTLMADYLKRIIQDNVDGHDSSEDACSCMELMIWKIKEDAKVKR
ncbi:RNA exonuclease 1 homolog [Ambystoma mexicanum]|uniref:RNA exonuclease 1 homolog n=1 Tax=Ambystoma mexicanum TaxID=8296 RepID=UPI0037E7AA1E